MLFFFKINIRGIIVRKHIKITGELKRDVVVVVEGQLGEAGGGGGEETADLGAVSSAIHQYHFIS